MDARWLAASGIFSTHAMANMTWVMGTCGMTAEKAETSSMAQVDAPLTQLLQLAGQGDRSNGSCVRGFRIRTASIAHQRLRRQGGIADLATTRWFRVFCGLIASDQRLADRQHFFAYAAKTMRSIIDFARKDMAERRGGGLDRFSWIPSSLTNSR